MSSSAPPASRMEPVLIILDETGMIVDAKQAQVDGVAEHVASL
jgi:hypothetical protein